MKKGIGCLVLILVILLVTVLKLTTGVTHGGTGIIGSGIIVGLVMFGWSLIKSKKDNSSNDSQIHSQAYKTADIHHTLDSDVANKEQKQSLSSQPNINPVNINEEVTENSKSVEYKVTEGIENKDESRINSFDEKIINIEIQYNKGVFTEEEKNSLIDNLTKRKEEFVDKIQNIKIVDILNNHRVQYERELERELSKINELYNDGLLTKEMLKEKNEKIKQITALDVQKTIIIETNKTTISLGKVFTINSLHFTIIEIIDHNRIKLIQLNDYSQQLIIDINSIEEKHSIELITTFEKLYNKKQITLKQLAEKRLELNSMGSLKSNDLQDIQFDDFKYKFEIDNFLFIDERQNKPISVGDLIDDGVVFSIEYDEILLFKKENNSLNHIDSYFYSGYEKFKFKEMNGWQIPYIWALKKYVEYCKERYLDLPNILWSSENSEFTTTKVMTVSKYPLSDYKTVSKESYAWGVLIKSIPNFNRLTEE